MNQLQEIIDDIHMGKYGTKNRLELIVRLEKVIETTNFQHALEIAMLEANIETRATNLAYEKLQLALNKHKDKLKKVVDDLFKTSSNGMMLKVRLKEKINEL